MDVPSVQLLGVYRVDLTQELFEQAMKLKFDGHDLAPDERQRAEEFVRQELSSLVLLEVIVHNKDEKFDVDDFGQEGSDQAPYDECFLSQDGLSVITDNFGIPTGDKLRIVFFFHFFDPTKPLKTSYGEVVIPDIKAMPKRLSELIHYYPID